MADWDEDSPRLRTNLAQVLRRIQQDSGSRKKPSLEEARRWHRDTMEGLEVSHREFRGGFRGEPGALRGYDVEIGSVPGVPSARVAAELAVFQARLQQAISLLDKAHPVGAELDADGLAQVLQLAAWSHAEWVRIHPFANGNGRTARLWANSILLRYGVPPVVRLRPRPDGGYEQARRERHAGRLGTDLWGLLRIVD
jgi:fido (protein-threonine AMPylation protein)